MNFVTSVYNVILICDEIKEDKKGTACYSHGGEGICLPDFGGEPAGKNQLEFIGIDGRITLKWMFRKQAGITPTGVIWLQVGDK